MIKIEQLSDKVFYSGYKTSKWLNSGYFFPWQRQNATAKIQVVAALSCQEIVQICSPPKISIAFKNGISRIVFMSISVSHST